MGNKWYEEINCDWFDEERERRKILKRRIKSACKATIIASVVSIIGLIGSAELCTISMAQFTVYELIAVAVLLISIRINNSIE